ncbi:hypothetical protein SE17_12825 [Kouleothrix aurantiaca]|uniref:Uncharacterized protein n=1 Tax=Kouleothrix aurantiaca TaxID=186479 RepID=A0A0P9D1S5_9CHLR|nr:hypothetical protein SE17_12825 [Kouleothrix aurantiaca]
MWAGCFWDGWAHNHHRVDNTFFTPWHAVFYSGFLAVALLLGGALALSMLRGRTWLDATPAGYELAILGVPLFAFGGVFDLIWHQMFGFEVGIEPLLSPSHLLLATGLAMIVSAPLRAARRNGAESGVLGRLPALLALVWTLSVITFLTQFTNPFVDVWARSLDDGILGHAMGVAGVLVQSALLVGATLFALRRGLLLPGGVTVLFTLNALLMTTQHETYALLPVALLAGALGDLLVFVLKPAVTRPLALRVFAFALPAALYLMYFLLLKAGGQLVWSTNLWTGATMLAGIVGLLLSYVAVPQPHD